MNEAWTANRGSVNARGADARPVILHNARIIDPSCSRDEMGAVVVADRRIVAVGPEADTIARPAHAEVIDCKGAIVAPGLVDMRVFEIGRAHV